MKFSFLLLLMLAVGSAHSSIYPDVDGASGVSVDQNSIYFIMFEDNFYFDNLLRAAAEGADLYLNIGFDGEGKMADEFVGFFQPEIITLGDGSIKGLVFSMKDHPFSKHAVVNFLENSLVLKLTVWNEDWFSTFTVASSYDLKIEYQRKIRDLFREYQLSH